MDHTLRDLMEALRGEDGMGRKRARETMVLIGDEIAPRMRTLLAEGTKRERWEAAKTWRTWSTLPRWTRSSSCSRNANPTYGGSQPTA
jgi:hypothetical protein